MDWQVFNRLYSEEFSIDLLHAWRQVRVIAFSVEVIVLENCRLFENTSQKWENKGKSWNFISNYISFLRVFFN